MNRFTPSEKQRAFDEISSHYFNKNFGSMTKTDYETLLFGIYLRHLKESDLPSDDYSISRSLGITQSKVRSLKMRNELRDPVAKDDSWMEEFADCVKTAIYDEKKRLVKVMVPEVTVMMELRHFMENNRWYDEYQLNPKLFQCPLDFYLPLCEKISGNGICLDNAVKEKLKELCKKANEKEQSAMSAILNGAVEDGFKNLVLNGSIAIVIEVLKTLPFGGVAARIVNSLIVVLSKSES